LDAAVHRSGIAPSKSVSPPFYLTTNEDSPIEE